MCKFYCDHEGLYEEYTPLLADNGIDEIGRLCLECGTDRATNEAARNVALLDDYTKRIGPKQEFGEVFNK